MGRGRWQSVVNIARAVLVVTGVTFYLQERGMAPWWQFACFSAGLGAIILWLRYARPHLWRQAFVLLLMLVYLVAVTLAESDRWIVVIVAAGMLLPVTLGIAGLYFASSRSSRSNV